MSSSSKSVVLRLSGRGKIVSDLGGSNMQLTTRRMARIAIMLALAIVLDYVSTFIPFLKMPQGGQATLGYIPLLVLALVEGWVPALIGSFMFTFLQWVYTPPYVVHWLQFLLDYPLPVILMVLITSFSLFYKRPLTQYYTAVVFTMLGSIVAYFLHVLAGVVFFAEYAGETPVWLYSFAYNGGYMLVTALVNLVAVITLYPIVIRYRSANQTL